MPRAETHSQPGAVRRVLMTADAVGGVWRYAIDLCAAWRRRQIDVTLAVMGPRPSPSQATTAVALGIDLVTCPFKLEWMEDAWMDVDGAGQWLLDLEQRAVPDIVHLNGFCHATLAWRAPVLVVGHSCVCSWWRGVHGADAPASWREYRTRVSAGLAAASVVVAPTHAMRAAFAREYGVARADARVIPNGRTRAHAPVDLSLKAPLVLAAGRIWDEAKNVRTLCAAAPSIAWPVYIAGAASTPTASLEPPADIGGPVTLLGQLDPVDLDRWFDRASIYALPAKYEPFGLSILEAASAGCALVLGDIPSLRENWSGAALFVSPDDDTALAAAIQSLIEDDEERELMARRARERAMRFSIERTAAIYLTAYREAIERDRTSTREHAEAAPDVAKGVA